MCCIKVEFKFKFKLGALDIMDVDDVCCLVDSGQGQVREKIGRRRRRETGSEGRRVKEKWEGGGGAKGKVSLEPMENEMTVLAFNYDDNGNLKFEIRIVLVLYWCNTLKSFYLQVQSVGRCPRFRGPWLFARVYWLLLVREAVVWGIDDR